jgi:hypothetical protein
MGSRTLRSKLLLFSFLFLPTILIGQIKNELDIHFKYRISFQSDSFPNNYLDEDYGYNGYISPTLLGNVKVGTSFEAGVLYSGLSFYFQPSINIAYTNYYGNDQLLKKFNNLKFRSYSISIGGKFNLVNYSKSSIIPYFNLNSGYRLSTIAYDETLYPVTLENNEGETKYSFDLKIPSNSELFFNPFVEIGIGVETKIKNKVYILFEGNLIFVNYPTIDIPNPTLSKESYISIGLRYKFLKNKRYYYD